MGQFLCIGIKTKIYVERTGLQKCTSGEDGARAIIERDLANRELYNLTVADDLLTYSLKEEIAESEWCAFIKDFYDIRYREIGERMEDEGALEAISSCTTLSEWLSIAEQKSYQCYQVDAHWNYIDIGSFYSYRVNVKNVILSMDGKIGMECYDYLFRFLTNCIKKRLASYKLADVLEIYISD